MRFEGYKLSRFVMYNGWVIGFGMGCAWMFFYPIALGKGFMFFELFKKFFLSDFKLAAWFFFLTVILGQLTGYDSSRTKPKFLEVLEDKAVFHLLNGKTYEFKYSDLSSLDRTNDLYKIFLFTFKDGHKQKISNSIKNSELAFEMIRKKIVEVQRK